MNCLWDWRLFSHYTACNKYLIWCKDVFLAVKHLRKQELSVLYVVDEWNVMMPGHLHKETIQYLQDCRFLQQCCWRFCSSGLWWSVECVVPSVSKCLQLHYHAVLQDAWSWRWMNYDPLERQYLPVDMVKNPKRLECGIAVLLMHVSEVFSQL